MSIYQSFLGYFYVPKTYNDDLKNVEFLMSYELIHQI
jgi:hypothetical protein